MVKLKGQRRAANNGDIFTFSKHATSGMGKFEFFRTETPRLRHLLSIGEDQTVVSLKL